MARTTTRAAASVWPFPGVLSRCTADGSTPSPRRKAAASALWSNCRWSPAAARAWSSTAIPSRGPAKWFREATSASRIQHVMKTLPFVLIGIGLCLMMAAAAAGVPAVDPALPSFQPQGVLRGELHSVGADVMDDLTMSWIRVFRTAHPQVAVTMEARAPGTAIPALVNGWGQLGPVARELFPFEEEMFV